MATPEILVELGLILGIAAALALVGRLVKQPTMITYLITGVLVGPLFFNILKSTELIEIFAHLGVAFLLFIVGLSLDFRVLKEVGGISVIVGIIQILITGLIGFLIVLGLGFAYTPAIYIAAALAFSSTVVVVKLLSDKKELDSLHGKITLGILIVQDFAAGLVLMLIPLLGLGSPELIIEKLFLGGILISGIFLFTYLIIPGILAIASRNQEVLFLFSLGWALAISILFSSLGFSLEVGALIAGMSLASSKFSLEIGSKVMGMRSFFVVIHLVFFGSLLAGPITGSLLKTAIILSGLVLIGNPLIVMISMKFLGYKKRTNFFTGINIAQISEFSLILVFIGFTLGAVTQEILSLTILVALITIGISSYWIYYSQPLYKLFSPALSIFDGKGKHSKVSTRNKKHDVILFGYNRIGYNLLKSFHKTNTDYLVVDYNPKTIKDLSKKKINCIYGDANDIELLKALNLEQAKTIISTIPILETNLTILQNIKNDKAIFIPTSHNIQDSEILYESGADYVIMPHFLGGDFVAHMITRNDFGKKFLSKQGRKQRNELAERLTEGHDHPGKEHHGK